ncbi:MAG TPA: xanthine dehydrogenase small subunit [Xanthomonadales bacterium]|nr:xanthine dehydrogenase small subunit [Xanthomonadales bacterium]
MMGASIRFLLGNEVQELSGFDPQMTVLEWLRTHARRTGTKEGCAEGDCGACTVAVGEPGPQGVRYRAFNSCIQLLPTLDGKQLLTVEDLAGSGSDADGLHPVQQAMVDQHGSQCGFCTPGFVMSLFTLYHADGVEIHRQRIDQAIAGNLCRCTGYAPIVRAAVQAMETAPGDGFHRDRGQLATQLRQLRREKSLHLEYRGRHYHAPVSLAEVWQLLQQYPQARMVAGATDVGLWITKELRIFDRLINLCNVPELLRLEKDQAAGHLTVGAAVNYSDALEVLTQCYPGMGEMLLRLGAEQVRNAGTIGGNIANGSPIGDMPPTLIALDARLVLSSAAGAREIALEDFFLGYGRQDLRPGECVECIRVPLLQSGLRFAVYKVAKRFDQDISALCGAFCIRLENEQVQEARICFGGMAGIPSRARAAEQALLGQAWNEQTLRRAQAALALDYTPLTDWRASREYRALAAQNLLQRFYLQNSSPGSSGELSHQPWRLAGGKPG